MATVSNEGIKFQSLTFSCPEAFKAGWFLRDKHRTRPKKVEIAYDPRSTNSIYIFPKEQEQVFWAANLTERSRAFQDMTFYEAKQTNRAVKLMGDIEAKANKSKQLDAEEGIENRIRAAMKRHKGNTSDASARSRVSAIKANKKQALADERKSRSVGAKKHSPTQKIPNNVEPIKKPTSFEAPEIPDDIFGDDE